MGEIHARIRKEAGYDEAILGISLSYNSTIKRAEQIAVKLAFGRSGEGKFLESIDIWVDVRMPRFWWQEADTYRLSTKQSESTMHTVMKRNLRQDDFLRPIFPCTLEGLNALIEQYRTSTQPAERYELFEDFKNNLPEGFLQRRIWKMPYNVLQNIYNQRHDHRLCQWHYFLDTMLFEIEHPEFIVNHETL